MSSSSDEGTEDATLDVESNGSPEPIGSEADKATESEHSDEESVTDTQSMKVSDEVKFLEREKRFDYLINCTKEFADFLGGSRSPTKDGQAQASSSSQPGEGHRRRHTEQEEDAELLKATQMSEKKAVWFQDSPSFITGGTLRDYQIRGLNWLISLESNCINGILADEMGLGKTIQSISVLAYMTLLRKQTPHLVLAPKSTLSNWMREFKRFCPKLETVLLLGSKEERPEIRQRLKEKKYDVIVTSYEIAILEKSFLKKIHFSYMVIDEAHRIKNEKSLLSEIVRTFQCRSRILLTGTPLQNNLHELWALLNFLLPDVFSSSEDFDAWFDTNKCLGDKTLVSRLHAVLKPFLLRRVKSEVEKSLLPKKETKIYVPLTNMQRQWYKRLLSKDVGLLNVGGNKSSLNNVLMHLRKCCNHPYLFEGAEPGPPYTTDKHLVDNAGKMRVLHKLLPKLKEKGSRVLIFSQMTRMLDILEDYFWWVNIKYCRIDGNTAHEDRERQIDEFNEPGSEKFVFLLSTRAGGLGINLATADIVILYDSDWNPQVDLQAMDRAHRIGQKKQVHVFRLVTDKSVEERIVQRAEIKLRLDKLIIQQGRLSEQNKLGKNEMLEWIRHGAQEIFASERGEVTDEEIDEILEKSEERTKVENDKIEKLEEKELEGLTLDYSGPSLYEWQGQDYREFHDDDKSTTRRLNWIGPGKRERKVQTYDIQQYYKTAMAVEKEPSKPKQPKPPKQPRIEDYQFYPLPLRGLLNREMRAYQKLIKYKVPLDKTIKNIDEAELQQVKEQEEIDNAAELTDEEEALKQEMLQQGFANWRKTDVRQFVRMLEKFGQENMKYVIKNVPQKTPEEVTEYAKIFFKRMSELSDCERFQKMIEKGNARLQKQRMQQAALDKKIGRYFDPTIQLKLFNVVKNKYFSKTLDKRIVIHVQKIGVDCPTLVYELFYRLKNDYIMRNDWTLCLIDEATLVKRVDHLIKAVEKDVAKGDTDQKSSIKLDPVNKAKMIAVQSAKKRKKNPVNGNNSKKTKL